MSILKMMMVSKDTLRLWYKIMCFFSVVVVEFETEAYTVVEDAGPFTVCVTKDKTTTSPIIILLTPEETSPSSATGDHSQSQ